MKKIIISFLGLSLIAFYCSTNLNAQSSEKDLDQVELMKQFVGKWITEAGEDTTVIWEIIPFAKGYESKLNWQAKGETYSTIIGIMGFARGKQLVNWYHLWLEGGIGRDLGKFESDKKLTLERFNADHTNVSSTFDYHLITLDKFKLIWKRRGTKESWDDAEVTEWIFTRVKE